MNGRLWAGTKTRTNTMNAIEPDVADLTHEDAAFGTQQGSTRPLKQHQRQASKRSRHDTHSYPSFGRNQAVHETADRSCEYSTTIDGMPVMAHLCVEERWLDVIHRCQTHPHEARAMSFRHDDEFTTPESDTQSLVPLALACAWDPSNTVARKRPCTQQEEERRQQEQQQNLDLKLATILALIDASPEAIHADQVSLGHTPLRCLLLRHNDLVVFGADVVRRMLGADFDRFIARGHSHDQCDETEMARCDVDLRPRASTVPVSNGGWVRSNSAGRSRDNRNSNLPAVLKQDENGQVPLDLIIQHLRSFGKMTTTTTTNNNDNSGGGIDVNKSDWIVYLQLLDLMLDHLVQIKTRCEQMRDLQTSQRCEQVIVQSLIRCFSVGCFQQYHDCQRYQIESFSNPSHRRSDRMHRLQHLESIVAKVTDCIRKCASSQELFRPPIPRQVETTEYGQHHGRGDRTCSVLATTGSQLTACTVLHMAIKNYGESKSIIQSILDSDPNREMLEARNLYSDLPLHVAVSVGIPLDILNLILSATIQRDTSAHRSTGARVDDATTVDHSHDHARAQMISPRINTLCWSTNRRGYYATDLAWMHHVEANNGHSSGRSLYPLETTGIRRFGRKDDTYYRMLLDEAVESTINATNTKNQKPKDFKRSDGNAHHSVASALKYAACKASFGDLLDRYAMIIQTSVFAEAGLQQASQALHLQASLLHAIALVTSPMNPTPVLPQSILRLFLWIGHDHCCARDRFGMLPIDYAVQLTTIGVSTVSSEEPMATGAVEESPARTGTQVHSDGRYDGIKQENCDNWQSFVEQLLQLEQTRRSQQAPLRYPTDSSDRSRHVENPHGALHRLLRECNGLFAAYKLRNSFTADLDCVPHKLRHLSNVITNVAQSLMDHHPESIDCRDLSTQLYPFMHAATSYPLISLDVIYKSLRKSPARINTLILP